MGSSKHHRRGPAKKTATYSLVDELMASDSSPLAPALQAVSYLVEDSQSVAESLPARTIIRCLRLTEARLRKQVHQRAGVAQAHQTQAGKH